MKNPIKNWLRALFLLIFGVGMSQFTFAQSPCNCPAPTLVKVKNVTSNSAQVSWTPPPVPVIGYTVKVKNVSTGIETSIDVGLSNPYTLVGLLPNTPYEVRVIANCSATCKSLPTTPIKFQTEPNGIIILDVIVQVSSSPTGLNPKGMANASAINWSSTYTGTQYIKVTANNQSFWIKRKDMDSFEIINPSNSGLNLITIGAGSIVPISFSAGQAPLPYGLEMTSSGVRVSSGPLSLQLFY